MATKIKDTPVLMGEDAIEFMKQIENVISVSKEDLKRMQANYEIFKSLIKKSN